MKRVILIFCTLISVFCSATNTIHWLTFVDTTDPNVGSMDVNGRDMLYRHFINKVNAALANSGYASKSYDYYGYSTSPEMCEQLISDLQCSENDIVVFYYIGHGVRAVGDSDKYPQMCLASVNQDKFIPLTWVHKTLKAKQPRLLLTIGMCCNSVSEGVTVKTAPTFTTYNGVAYYANSEVENIRKLFLENKGDIIISSSKAGQTSVGGYVFETGTYMDIFTLCYVADFNIYVSRTSNPNWSTLLDAVSTDVSQLAYTHFRYHRQNPQWDINTVATSRPSKQPSPLDTKEVSKEVSKEVINQPIPIPIPSDKSTRKQDKLSACLTSVFDAIIDKDNDLSIRKQSADIIQEYCSQNAIVKVLAENSEMVVDKINIADFLLLASTSKEYHKIVVSEVKTAIENSSKKISELYVREYMVKK